MLGDSAVQPSVVRGKTLYADRCADGHADDGLGTDEGRLSGATIRSTMEPDFRRFPKWQPG